MIRRACLSLAVVAGAIATPVHAAPGDLDPSFAGDGAATSFRQGAIATAVEVDADRRIVVAGYTLDGEVDLAVARFLPDGTPDPAFGGGDGRVRLDLGGIDYVFDAVTTPEGRILVAGQRIIGARSSAFVVALGARGNPSADVGGGDGIAFVRFGRPFQAAAAIALTPKGRIVIGGFTSNGTTSRSAVARLLADGTRDPSFSGDGRFAADLSDGAEQVNDLFVLEDGRIVTAGYAEAGLQPRFALMRLLGRGTRDRTFGDGGQALTNLGPGADIANAIVRTSDGKLAVVGRAGNGVRDDWGIVRYGFRGRLDPAFGDGGIVVLPLTKAAEEAIDVATWGARLVVAGRSRGDGTKDDLTVARLKAGGALDTTFGDGGWVRVDLSGSTDAGRSVALQPNGRIVAAGEGWQGGVPRFLVVRLRST